MMMADTGPGDVRHPLAGRHRLSRNVAVHPLNRLGGRERQGARDHLVERHAECVKVATAVDRTVHAPRSFGSHIGKRACDGLGRPRQLPLARQSRGNPEACQPHLTSRLVDQDVRRLDVVDDPSTMHFAESARKTNGEPQEAAQLHRRSGPRAAEILTGRGLVQQSRERLAWLVLQNQGPMVLVLREEERPQRPARIEIVPEGQFVFQHPDVSGQWML